ncbi:hypothetical protein ACSU1N_05100 [Thermogladius sp. 4427co]
MDNKPGKKPVKGLIIDEDIVIQYSLNTLQESSCSNCPLRGICPFRKTK